MGKVVREARERAAGAKPGSERFPGVFEEVGVARVQKMKGQVLDKGQRGPDLTGRWQDLGFYSGATGGF